MKTDEQKWEELLDALQVAAMEEQPDEYGLAQVKPKISALNLIQPFDWMKWTEPYPSVEQTKLMDLDTAIKHITRFCRAERFMEGTLWAGIQSGAVLGLCLVVRQHTDGKAAPKVM